MPQFFIDRPVFAWVVALFILLAGALAIPQLPVAQYPDVAPPQIEIYAVYPGASAQTVDESVVSLIEEELNGADHLLYFESQSSLGSATIKATFQPGTNPEMAQVDVQNRLKVVESRLPQAVNQQGLQVEKVSAGFLLLITLTSTDGKLDDVALSDYLARNVMNEIKRLDGVGKAQLYGAERAMRIWIDPQKLLGFNLTPADVNAAIVAQNADSERVHEGVRLVHGVEPGLAADVRKAETVAVERDTGDDSVDNPCGVGVRDVTEAESIHHGHRSRAHRDDVAHNPADARGCALERLDV